MTGRRPRWGPSAGETPLQHYLIRPRHLAGGGDTRYITGYLSGAGWKNRARRGDPPTCFESPDRSMRIAYLSRTSPPMWIISGQPPGEPAWTATVGAAVPVEILAGLTDALAQPRPAHAPDVLGQLTARGWIPVKGDHPTAGHPDGTALVQYRNENKHPMWWASAHITNVGGSVPLWNAGFSEHTPLHAIVAFAAALADPRPVLRPPGRIPFASALHVSITAYPVLRSQLASSRLARTAAGRAAWFRSTRDFALLRAHRRVPDATLPAVPPRPTHPPRSR